LPAKSANQPVEILERCRRPGPLLYKEIDLTLRNRIAVPPMCQYSSLMARAN
jgi:hypothetical protein